MVVATHSPILLALPGATILEITDDGTMEHIDYEQASSVQLTRDFLACPQRFLRHLLDIGGV
jgi:predicted ATPase